MRLLTLPLTLAIKVVRGAVGLVRGSEDPGPTPTMRPPQPRYARPSPPPEPAPAGEPAHVSEEPELVAEVAEPGAEDGAGAELHFEEPWPGYDEMTAADIRSRLRGEGTAAAAAVRLYEAAGKGRSSVLEAAGRELSARPSG